jgi:hypothetical protein
MSFLTLDWTRISYWKPFSGSVTSEVSVINSWFDFSALIGRRGGYSIGAVMEAMIELIL